MTSVKFHFRPSSKTGLQEGKLFIRIIHDRIPKSIRTPYAVFPQEWDESCQRIRLSDNDDGRLVYLLDLQERMNDDLKRIHGIIRNLDSKASYRVQDITDAFANNADDNSLLGYAEELGRKLREEKRPRTARAYRTVVNGLIRYNAGRNIRLIEINSMMLQNFQEDMRMKGRHFNTISFYMRNLRAIYNKAIRDRKIPQRKENPFDRVFTGICESPRRALHIADVAKLHDFQIELERKLPATDMGVRKQRTGESLYRTLMYFIFCCEARGMSFVDMIYLKKGDISENKIQYMRKKTGQILTLKITDDMQTVIEKFGCRNDSPYVFPILDPEKPDIRLQYESALRAQNKRLNRIGKMLSLSVPLTTHVARHTWATLAKWNNVEMSKISEGLGHNNIKTTIRYLASFEESVLDQVSEQIASLIKCVA